MQTIKYCIRDRHLYCSMRYEGYYDGMTTGDVKKIVKNASGPWIVLAVVGDYCGCLDVEATGGAYVQAYPIEFSVSLTLVVPPRQPWGG